MKRTSVIILAALLGATLHTGCKKAENTAMVDSANAHTVTDMTRTRQSAIAGAAANVAYKLTVNPSTAQSPAQWQKGQFTAAELTFSGGMLGNAPSNITPVSFSKPIDITGQLFAPINLGVVDVRSGLYNTMDLAIRLSPNNGPALLLGGSYSIDGNLLNMQFIVESDVILTGHLQGPLNLNAQKYNASLLANIDDLMNGVSIDLIRNATINNAQTNTVIVSKEINPQLYQAMITGLTNLPITVQLVPILVPSDTYISVVQDK